MSASPSARIDVMPVSSGKVEHDASWRYDDLN